jgi:hypothetical protein
MPASRRRLSAGFGSSLALVWAGFLTPSATGQQPTGGPPQPPPAGIPAILKGLRVDQFPPNHPLRVAVTELAAVWKPSPYVAAAPAGSELDKLRIQLHTLAVEDVEVRFQRFAAGMRGETMDTVADIMDRAIEAECALTTRPEDQVEILTRWLALAKVFEQINIQKVESGLFSPADVTRAKFYYVRLRIRLLEAKERLAKHGPK